jgi:hypothetical protein
MCCCQSTAATRRSDKIDTCRLEALELLRHQWQDGKAENLFLIHFMPELLDKVTRVVADNLRVDKLAILDGGNG